MITHEWTFICRDFVADSTGVFSILDVARDFLFEGFPGDIQPFVIVSSFLGKKGETFDYSIRFADPAHPSRVIQSAPIRATCVAQRRAGYNVTARQPVDGLVVQQPGMLVFDVLVNGDRVHQEEIYIQSI